MAPKRRPKRHVSPCRCDVPGCNVPALTPLDFLEEMAGQVLVVERGGEVLFCGKFMPDFVASFLRVGGKVLGPDGHSSVFISNSSTSPAPSQGEAHKL